MMFMDKVPQAFEPQRPHKTLHACKTFVASLTSSNSGECFDCEFLKFSHTACSMCDSWSCNWGAKSTAEKHLKAGKASSMPNNQKPEKACEKNRTERRHEIWYQTASTTQIAATWAIEMYYLTTTKHPQTTNRKTSSLVIRNFTKIAFWHTSLPLAFSWRCGIGGWVHGARESTGGSTAIAESASTSSGLHGVMHSNSVAGWSLNAFVRLWLCLVPGAHHGPRSYKFFTLSTRDD